MPNSWMSREEAQRFFGGLIDTDEELERFVLDHDIDAEVDDDGTIITIDASDIREHLFELHRSKLGHRPDDPDAQAKAAKRERDREGRRRRKRAGRRALLEARHRR